MMCLMLVLVVFTLPALLLFATGDTVWESEGASADATQLWRFTPANIGSSSGVCEAAYANTGASISLRCPAGTVMTAVTASFGLNSGECSCPAARLPDENKQCPGNVRSDGTCREGEFCQYDPARDLSLVAGLGIDTGACCASSLSQGAANFRDLEFRAVPGCDSSSAQRLAEAMCLRQESCTLAADTDTPHMWPESDSDGIAARRCNGTERSMGIAALPDARSGSGSVVVDPAVDLTGSNVCAQTFSAFGGLSNDVCANPAADAAYASSYTYRSALLGNTTSATAGAPHLRLLATATCSSLYVEIPGYLRIPKDSVAMIVMVCDIALLASFLIAVGVLSRREGEADDGVEVASPADYTVVIRSLPPHSSVTELDATLRAHLRGYLDSSMEVVKPNAKLGGHGCAVADINFGYDSEILTELKVMHGDAAAKLQRLVAEMRARSLTWRQIQASADYKLLMERGGGCAVRFCNGYCLSCCGSIQLRLAHRIEKAKRALAEASGAVEQVREKDTTTKAILAFVTFVEEEAVFRARAEFPNSTCYATCCLPAQARLPYTDPRTGQKKGWPLRVMRAEEPADLIWENIRFAKNREGAIRRACSGFVTLLVLVMAFGAIYLLERQRILAARQYPAVDCSIFPNPSDKAAALTDERFEAFGLPDGRSGRIQCYCTELLLNSSGNVITLFDEQFPVPNSPAIAAGSSSTVLASDAARTQGGSAGSGVTDVTVPGGWALEQLCSSWVQSYFQVQLLTYGSAVVVLVLKAMVTVAIRFVVRHEKRMSKTEQTLSRASKMFVSQFVITSILVVLINARINEAGLSGVFIGEHTDFDADWYKGPGAAITLTMLLNVAFDAITPIRRVLVRQFARCRDRGCRRPPNPMAKKWITGKATQAELNEMYSGILMPMDELYASLVNQIFVCVTFCTGMPLLIPTACLFAAVFFVVHKTLFATSYRTPTSTSEILSRRMTAFLPMAGVFHAFIGAWMLSNPEVFPSTREVEAATSSSGTASIDDAINGLGSFSQSAINQLRGVTFSGYNLGDRIAKAHVYPLFVCGVILLVLGIVRITVGKAVFKFGKACFTACRCCCACFLKAEDAGFENLKPYWDALPDSVLDDFPRTYHPKVALTGAYRQAKERRRESQNATAKAARMLDTRLAALREARGRLEATNDEVTDLAQRVTDDKASDEDKRRLGELTTQLEEQAAELKQHQEVVAAAHRRATLIKRRAIINRRLSRVIDKADEERLRASLGADDEGAPPADMAAKTISSSMVHSYDIDDNSSYVTRFGFHVVRSIADADLLREVRPYMPSPHGRREAARSRRALSRRGIPVYPVDAPAPISEDDETDTADDGVAELADVGLQRTFSDETRSAADSLGGDQGYDTTDEEEEEEDVTSARMARATATGSVSPAPDSAVIRGASGAAAGAIPSPGSPAAAASAPVSLFAATGSSSPASIPWHMSPGTVGTPVSGGMMMVPAGAMMQGMHPAGQPMYVQTPQGVMLVSPYSGGQQFFPQSPGPAYPAAAHAVPGTMSPAPSPGAMASMPAHGAAVSGFPSAAGMPQGTMMVMTPYGLQPVQSHGSPAAPASPQQ